MRNPFRINLMYINYPEPQLWGHPARFPVKQQADYLVQEFAKKPKNRYQMSKKGQ